MTAYNTGISSRQNKEQDIPLNLKFYSHVGAQAQKNDAAALQAMMLQASLSDSSTLQAMMQRESPLHAMMAARQLRNRMISAAVESAPRTISPESNMFGNQVSLDVMTERFIRQSVEKMMKMQVLRSHLSNGIYRKG